MNDLAYLQAKFTELESRFRFDPHPAARLVCDLAFAGILATDSFGEETPPAVTRAQLIATIGSALTSLASQEGRRHDGHR